MTVCGAVRAFRNLPASALTKIAQIASPPTTYQAGELISDGQGEQALLLVVAGKAKVSLLSVDGNENILYLLKGGDVDGQAALFVRQPRLARLIEAVYPTTVIRLRHDAFQDLLASSPLLARELLNIFGARLAELEVDNSRLHLLDAKERLYAYLLDWERDYQSSTYQLAMTKGEVANWLGITPANLSRCLKQLVTEGKTSVRGRQITIHHGAL
ncbi:Crp/Fnr family transcriptional regulator [Limosilactobacillus fermentum]|uniref:Crp/Fnr family transcriptional regulator n=1 Tax=Limosilactobacillus fermentum TaxID=1613 RepID=UPI00214D9FD0|nr:Crp/Fnr family transcriptional regulator [Limosilactobacillus fermentum]UUV94801.1 Crp/Fnr family transcriptional regulator [Limosilactobacillus fermentum]